jgi:PAS domain S-box-containing protein
MTVDGIAMTPSVMLDAIDLQIWTADDAGELTFVNEFTARFFDKPREQLIGEGWQNVLHSADVPVAVERWTSSITTGDEYHVDFRLLRGSDRTYRWHHASARRIEQDGVRVWVGSNVDVDAEKRADEVLQAWRTQLRGRSE